jgi:hypothetical protein
VKSLAVNMLFNVERATEAAHPMEAALTKRPTWAQSKGNPLPLGVTWIAEEQAFNFAVHSELRRSECQRSSIPIGP